MLLLRTSLFSGGVKATPLFSSTVVGEATTSTSGDTDVGGLRIGSPGRLGGNSTLLGDGEDVLELDVTGVDGGEDATILLLMLLSAPVTVVCSRAFRADDVILARRCWKEPGGGSGRDRGPRALIALTFRPPGDVRPSELKAAAEE